MIRRFASFAIVALFAFVLGLLSAPALNQLTQKIQRHTARTRTAGAPMDSPGYQQKSSEFAALGQTRRIVFLGDSRIEHGQWSELFDRPDISNRGISGDTTEGVVRRLATSVPTDRVLCVLQVGINDLALGVPVAKVVENYGEILSYLRHQRQAQIIVTSIILAGVEHAELNASIGECNRALLQLANSSDARWIDLNPSLAPDGLLAPRFTYDGVHLNGAGYGLVRDLIAPFLKEVH